MDKEGDAEHRDSLRYPSLDLVRAELDTQVEDQARKSTMFDTRAGFVIAFGGLLIGLTPQDPSMVSLIGRVAAIVAVAAAAWSLRYRVVGEINVESLRDHMLDDPENTKLQVLDTRIWLLQQDEERFKDKVFAMKYSVFTLFVAVCLILTGSIVDYINDKEAGDGTQDSRVTSSGPQVPPRSATHGQQRGE